MTREEILNMNDKGIIENLLNILEILLATKDSNYDIDFFELANIKEEELYQIVCNFYGKQASKEELLNYLFQEFKYDFLNRLIEEEFVRETNPLKQDYLLANLEKIRDEVLAFITNKDLINSIVTEEEKKEYSTMSREDINNIVKDFLSHIDNSKFLLKEYNRLIKNNKLIFLNNEEDLNIVSRLHNIPREELSYTTSYQSNEVITIVNNNSLNNVVDIIHEFIHYLNLHNKKLLPVTLLEFLPITYEYLAVDYLREQQKDEFEIRQIISDRKLNTLVTGLTALDFLDLLLLYKENGYIDKDLVYNFFKEEYDPSMDKTLSEFINTKIDNLIQELHLEKANIYKDISYVLGDILALKYYEFAKENTDNLEKVNELTTTINNYTEEEVFNLVEKEKVLIND